MKNHFQSPKNESGLVHLIRTEKSISHKWVDENTQVLYYGNLPKDYNYKENKFFVHSHPLAPLLQFLILLNLKYYANMPMQYTAIFFSCKNDNF